MNIIYSSLLVNRKFITEKQFNSNVDLFVFNFTVDATQNKEVDLKSRSVCSLTVEFM